MTEPRLVRHLAIAIAVKLALLAALWWIFVRDHSTTVDAQAAAAHVIDAPASSRSPQEVQP
jgi:hypothetical protein